MDTVTGPIVVKIGGSTLGTGDTTLSDVVALRKLDRQLVVVHGGGALINEWLSRLHVDSEFVDGLRSTNSEALDVVVAVLRGIINTQLVAQISMNGGHAVGLSGVDGTIIQAERYDPRLGFVGRIKNVNTELLMKLINTGSIPVVAPIGIEAPDQPLNINGDTVAGEIARSLRAERLIFLTDVDGILDAEGHLMDVISQDQATEMRKDETVVGGMIPKLDACLRATETGTLAYVANGQLPNTLNRIVGNESIGTRIGG